MRVCSFVGRQQDERPTACCSGYVQLSAVQAYMWRLEQEYTCAMQGLLQLKKWMESIWEELLQLTKTPPHAIPTCHDIQDMLLDSNIPRLVASGTKFHKVSEDSQRAWESHIDYYNEDQMLHNIVSGFPSKCRHRSS